MRILITGGCGFIGSNLIKYLNNKGYNDIYVLDNLSKGSLSNLVDCNIVDFFESDIVNYKDIVNYFNDIDVVIHLAAYGSVVESVENPQQNFDINAAGTLNVLRCAAEKGVSKFVFSSTGGALIGNAVPPVNEKSVPRPISPYGAGKLACEGYCCAFSHSYNMNITSLRFANVVGPTSYHKKGAVSAFIKAMIKNNPIEIFGNGEATRDYLHVNDLCNGILLSLESNKTGFNVYHLASGFETSVNELSSIIMKVLGKENYPIKYHSKRPGEVEKNFASYKLAKEELGFEPEHSLRDAILDTYKSFTQ